MGKGFRLLDWSQEPITRILQLPHIPVTAFSQTDLFLVWIYVEFSSPQEPQWPIAIISTDQCWHVDNFTWSRIVLSSPKRAHVDWNWPISREKYLKIVCKNALALAYYGSCRLHGLLLKLMVFQRDGRKQPRHVYWCCLSPEILNLHQGTLNCDYP